MALVQWRDRRRDARERKEAENRPLRIEVEDWDAKVGPTVDNANIVLVEISVHIMNPASADNVVTEANLTLNAKMTQVVDGEPREYNSEVERPALKPEWKAGQGPWVLGDTRVSDDAIAPPVNVPARASMRGRLYFALPPSPGSSALSPYRNELSEMRLCVKDLRNVETMVNMLERS